MTNPLMNSTNYVKRIAVISNITCLVQDPFMLFNLAIHLVVLKLEIIEAVRL
jgi:hypothetical protein